MNVFRGWNFQRNIILRAVRWYCRYGINYRELQEMLAERGVNVDHTTIYPGLSYMRRKWSMKANGTKTYVIEVTV